MVLENTLPKRFNLAEESAECPEVHSHESRRPKLSNVLKHCTRITSFVLIFSHFRCVDVGFDVPEIGGNNSHGICD